MRGFGSPGSRRAQPLVAGLRAGALHRARAGRRSDDAGVNVHVRGQGIAAAGSWHCVKGTGGFSRRAVHKWGNDSCSRALSIDGPAGTVRRYAPTAGGGSRAGGMHRRACGGSRADSSSMPRCTGRGSRVVCADDRWGQSHRRAGRGSRAVCTDEPLGQRGQSGKVRTDGPGGAVGRYAPTASGGSRATPTGREGQSGGMHRRGRTGRQGQSFWSANIGCTGGHTEAAPGPLRLSGLSGQ